VIALYWTERAQSDLAATQAFIAADSPAYAKIVVRRLISAVDPLRDFPNLGRSVPEFPDSSIREVVLRPYRIVYRMVSPEVIHILTIHHSARGPISSV
jgi:plasmid stabilization system protein ParE